MMMTLKFSGISRLLVALTLLLSAAVPTQARLNIMTVSVSDGLSDSSVSCLFQDSQGRLWIGTWDGLNLYTGTTCRKFRYIPGNEETIPGAIIMSIAEDAEGMIWLATDGGICCLDPDRGTARTLAAGSSDRSRSADNVYYLSVSGKGDLFCSSLGDGVYHYDSRKDALELVASGGIYSEIRKIICLGDSSLLLYTSEKSAYKVTYSLDKAGRMSLSDAVRSHGEDVLYEMIDSGDELFLCGESGVIHTLEKSSGKEGRIVIPDSGAQVTAVIRRPGGAVLVATAKPEVLSYSPETGAWSRFDELSGYRLFCFCTGIENLLWCGTDGSGVVGLYSSENYVASVPSVDFCGKDVPVRAFLKTRSGDLFIGTKGSGVTRIAADGTVSRLPKSPVQENNSVYALAETAGGDVVIGHDGIGISVYSPDSGLYEDVLPLDGRSFRSVYSIHVDAKNDCIWLGTYGYGLVMLKLEKRGGHYAIVKQHLYKNDKSDENSLGNNGIFSIVPLPDGNLALGTRGGGVNIFNPKTGFFRRFHGAAAESALVSDDVLSIAPDSDSVLWIGTSYGLDRLTIGRDGEYSFRSWTEDDGLVNNTVHGVIKDRDGLLWLTTSHGLASFDPETETFTGYSLNQAMQQEYSDGAYYMDSDGLIYAGGNNGYDSFRPESMRKRTYLPPILIDGFSVRQRALPKSDFLGGHDVVLSHDDNFFTISFSALEYIDNASCEYSYILEGFDEKWVSNGNSRSAVFTNVPPGKYVFKVKGTNGDKLVNPEPASVRIVIRRPWWNTGWAFAIYLALFCLATYFMNEYFKAREKRREEAEKAEAAKRQQQEMYEAKLNFFTNIAHEFGTPLTLISGSCGQLSADVSLKMEDKKYLSIIQNSANRMHRLIQELMDFRKIESGHRPMQYSLVCVNEMLASIVDNFSEAAEEKNIDFKFETSSGRIMLVTDPDALERIVSNLLSNAFKYTPEAGDIEIRLADTEKGVTITVINTGKGIRPDQIGTVFNRFSILDNLEQQATKGRIFRNGIGLSLALDLSKALGGDISVSSVPNDHTVFCFSHPFLSKDLIVEAAPKEAPAMEPVAEDAGVAAVEEPKDPSAEPQPRQKILVVDDDKEIRGLVKSIFQDRLDVLEASDGVEALEVFKETLVDLVITDMVMPRMDGAELAKSLKSNDMTRHIPIVFLTFKDDIELRISSCEIGGEAFIPKPFYPKHLKSVVYRILADRSTLKDYYNSARSSTDIYKDKAVNIEDKKFMLKVTDLIEKNLLDEHLSPSFLSECLNISKVQLYRKMKEISGETPGEFIRNIKIDHAASLLLNTGLTVSEVMYDSGFNNKSYFFREFSRKYHCTPKAYREQQGQV